MINTTEQLIGALIILAAGFMLKIVWDWLMNLKKETPRAENGFLSLADLTSHCRTQQENCTKHLMGKMELVIVRLENRLENGDKLFINVQKTLRAHSRVLIHLSKQLKEMDRKYGDAARDAGVFDEKKE